MMTRKDMQQRYGMTTKEDSTTLDTMSCILHAAEQGVAFETYMDRVRDYGRKRIRMISKGLVEE